MRKINDRVQSLRVSQDMYAEVESLQVALKHDNISQTFRVLIREALDQYEDVTVEGADA